VLFIIVGVNIFSAIFMAMGCGKTLGTLFALLGNKWLFFISSMVLIYLLGMIIDWTAILMLLVPIFFPIAQQVYDINPFWFAMMVSINLQASFLSPPFGYALFFMKSLGLKGAVPFIALQILGLIIVVLFPGLVTFLVNIAFGK
jgi:TRAP-type mannitol/chloroaromatic compound transport system permease large subunit